LFFVKPRVLLILTGGYLLTFSMEVTTRIIDRPEWCKAEASTTRSFNYSGDHAPESHRKVLFRATRHARCPDDTFAAHVGWGRDPC